MCTSCSNWVSSTHGIQLFDDQPISGCFLLKYRLRDTFTVIHSPTSDKLLRSKMSGYFLEMLAIYYLASNHREFFTHSRSTEMMFPSPSASAMLK